jgi:cytochrome o ubiquinol oxidase operon protein cyoD
MIHPDKTSPEISQDNHVSVRPYVVGFISAVILTLAAYFIIVDHWLSGIAAIGAIAALAVVQLVVQLIFFLHLAREKKPRWNLVVFLFMLMIVTLILGGSLWIMYSLNYNMMSPTQMDKYMQAQSSDGF